MLLSNAAYGQFGMAGHESGPEIFSGMYFERHVDAIQVHKNTPFQIVRSRQKKKWYINQHWLPLTVKTIDQTVIPLSLGGRKLHPKLVYDCPVGTACAPNVDNTTFTDLNDVTLRRTDSGFSFFNSLSNITTIFDQSGCLVRLNAQHGGEVNLAYEQGQSTGITVPTCGDRRLRQVSSATGEVIFSLKYDDNSRLDAIVDGQGFTVYYHYDDSRRLIGFTDARGYLWKYGYNEQNLVSTLTEPAGREITIVYGTQGVARMVDQEGVGYEFDRDIGGKFDVYTLRATGGPWEETWLTKQGMIVKKVIGGFTIFEGEHQESYSKYNFFNGTSLSIGSVFSKVGNIRRADGSEVKMERNQSGQMRLYRTAAGTVTRFGRDSTGTVRRLIVGEGSAGEMQIDIDRDDEGRGREIALKNGDETYKTTLTWSEDGSPSQITGPDNDQYTYKYGSKGELKDYTDGADHLTFAYDPGGLLLTVESEALGRLLTRTYDPVGRVKSHIDADGVVYTFDYDLRGKLLRQGTGSVVTAYTYDLSGRLKEIIFPGGSKQQRFYDSFGRLARLIDHFGETWTYSYPTAGEAGGAEFGIPKEIVGASAKTGLLFDKLGRLVRTIDQIEGLDPKISVYGYNPDGVLNSYRSPFGAIKMEADALGRPVSFSGDYPGGDVGFEYNSAGYLVSRANAKGFKTKFKTRPSGLVASIELPLGQTWNYDYDNAGRVSQVADPDENRMSLGYGPNGLTSVDTRDVNMTITRGASGRVEAWSSAGISGTITYNDLGQVQSQSIDYGPFSKTVTYEYDIHGRRSARIGTDKQKVSYEYDEMGRLSTIKLPTGDLVSFSDFHKGIPQRTLFPGGATHERARNAAAQLVAVTSKDAGGNVLYAESYARDGADRVVEIKNALLGNTNLDYHQRGYLAAVGERSLKYDSTGSRLSDSLTGITYSEDANGRLQSAGQRTFNYDGAGRLVAILEAGVAVSQLVWDQAGRLKELRDGSGALIATYGYDPFDRRIWKETGGKRSYFFYEFEGVTVEFDATGKEKIEVGYLPYSRFSTAPLMVKDASGFAFIHRDQNEVPVMITNRAGKSVWQATYDAFGKARVETGNTLTFNLRLPGQYYDAESGLHYNLLRYYAPDLGRYISPDPIDHPRVAQLAAAGVYYFPNGIPDPHPYLYVINDPVNRQDEIGGLLQLFVPVVGCGVNLLVYWATESEFAGDCAAMKCATGAASAVLGTNAAFTVSSVAAVAIADAGLSVIEQAYCNRHCACSNSKANGDILNAALFGGLGSALGSTVVGYGARAYRKYFPRESMMDVLTKISKDDHRYFYVALNYPDQVGMVFKGGHYAPDPGLVYGAVPANTIGNVSGKSLFAPLCQKVVKPLTAGAISKIPGELQNKDNDKIWIP